MVFDSTPLLYSALVAIEHALFSALMRQPYLKKIKQPGSRLIASQMLVTLFMNI